MAVLCGIAYIHSILKTNEVNNEGTTTMQNPVIGIMGAMEEEVKDIKQRQELSYVPMYNPKFRRNLYLGKAQGFYFQLIASKKHLHFL